MTTRPKGRQAPPAPVEVEVSIELDAVTAHTYEYLARAMRGEITDEETLDQLGRLLIDGDQVEAFPLEQLAQVMEGLTVALVGRLREQIKGRLSFGDLRILSPARRGQVDREAALGMLTRCDIDAEALSDVELINVLRLIDTVQRKPAAGKEKN